MTIHLCIANSTISTLEFHQGATLSDAVQAALKARGVTITADHVQPLGSTHYHIVYRDVAPDEFWSAVMTHNIIDDEQWGYGPTNGAAVEMASPSYE